MALQSDEEWKCYLLKGTIKIGNIYLHIVMKTAVDLCTHARVDIIVWELGYSSLVGSA